MSATHRNVSTPNPGFCSLQVEVSEASLASSAGILPAEGTLYGSSDWKTFFGGDYRKEYSGFRYVTQLGGTRDGISLLFVRARTSAENNTPFRTTTRFGNHHWHPILKSLQFVAVDGFPLATQAPHIALAGNTSGTAYATRYLVREVYIPSVDEGTRFVIEEFTSDTPFTIPQYPIPTPTAISYDLINIRGGFPECLHRKIVIDDLVGTIASQATGALLSAINMLKGQIFPATNFIEWAPYVISDTQELTNNCYYRKRIRVYPPPIPETIIRFT